MAEVKHDKTPSKHSSIVGGSTASRMLGCTGHYELLKLVPDEVKNRSSSYADEGTGLHEVMAFLVGEDTDIVEGRARVDELFIEYELNEDRLYDAVIPALRAFNEFLDYLYDEAEKAGFEDPEVRISVEQELVFPDVEGGFGTGDVIIKTPIRTVIWDWKFGAGKLVKAAYVEVAPGEHGPETRTTRGNDQLMFYATAARNTLPQYFEDRDDWPVTLVICQPRIGDGEPSKFTTNVGALEDFRLDMVEAVEEALSGKGVKALPSKGGDDYCYFAACKSICPLHLNGPEAAANISGKLLALKEQALTVDDLKESTVEIIPPGQSTPVDFSYGDALALLLTLKATIDPLLNSAAADAQTYMEAGGAVPGYKLVAKKAGHDSWDDEKAVDKFLGRRGIDTTDRRVVKPVSPAVARKLLKSKGDAKGLELVEKYVKSGVSSGHTLASESDARPSIETTAASVTMLANKIAALTEQ